MIAEMLLPMGLTMPEAILLSVLVVCGTLLLILSNLQR